MRKTKNLLEQLADLFPPRVGQHHKIELVGGTLDVTLTVERGNHVVSLDEYDLDCPTVEAVEEIAKTVREFEASL